jgi:hypothetical protein
MTVHDYIVIYYETFKYIEKEYGVDNVKELWSTISGQWCTHLRELIKSKGLEGMLQYWGGNKGTLGREKADFEVSLCDGIFKIDMTRCPSVWELRERKREIYKGKLNYCDHCPALYPPIARGYGFKMITEIDYDDNGECAGSCRLISFRSEE